MALRNGEGKGHSGEIIQGKTPIKNPIREMAVESCVMARREIGHGVQRIYGSGHTVTEGEEHTIDTMLDNLVGLERNKTKKHIDTQPDISIRDFSSTKHDLPISSLFAKTNGMDFQDAWFDERQHMYTPQVLLVRQGILREMGASSYFRTSHTSIFSLSEPVPGADIMTPPEVGRYFGIAREMATYGVDVIGEYYKSVGAIQHAHSGAQIDQQCLELQRALQTLRLERGKQDEITYRIREVAKERGEFIHRNTLHQKQREIKKEDYKSGADQIQADFDATWSDFQFFTPEEEKTFLSEVPKFILDAGIKYKKWANFASFSKRQSAINDAVPEGMHLRLGRGEILAKFHKTESALANDPEYKKYSNRFTKEYANRVRDSFLVSEASGFEFEEKLKIAEGVRANDLVLQTMTALLQQHRPKDSKSVNFTLLFGENRMRKVGVKVHENITPSELAANIQLAIQQSEDVEITNAQNNSLSMHERAQLGFTGYSPNRLKDKNYQHIYGFEEKGKKKLFSKKKVTWGDYLIQIKDSKNVKDYLDDEMSEASPESLFVVDSHQAAVLIDQRQMRKDGMVKTVVRYNHTRFDGIQAKTHAKHVLDSLSESQISPSPVVFSKPESIFSLPESDGNVYPALEGRATHVDEGVKYPKLVLNQGGQPAEAGTKPDVLSPAFTRSFILALANGVDTYHHLHAGDKSKSELYEVHGDRFDDVQPITTLLVRLRREFEGWKKDPSRIHPEFVQEYLQRYDGAKKRAERSHSDSLVSAAIVGRYEKPIVAVGSTVNKGISSYSTPGSMFSPLPPNFKPDDKEYKRYIKFRTAHSKSFASQKINLLNQHPEKSMGIIGYIQEGTVGIYTCRKMPCQAQAEFREAIVGELLAGNASEAVTTKTLTEFNKVLQSWDGMLNGKVSLEKFEAARNDAFNQLLDDDVCGTEYLSKQGITDVNSFQKYLNDTLQKAAESTFNEAKIEEARVQFTEFMKAAGVTVS